MILIFLLSVFIFVIGACIGSFLNCVIYRLENEKTLTGRSFCPNCRHSLSWQDLFPIFSFIFLGGKCRYCRKKISIQYPLIEIFTGLIFLAIFYIIGAPVSSRDFLDIIFLFYIASSLIVIFVYDLKHYEIPDKILFPAIAVTLVLRLVFDFRSILNFIVATAMAAGFFFSIWFFSKGRWMGFGDVKLAVLMGLLLGFYNTLVALFLAFFFGAIISIILIAFYGKKLKSEVPFGPFLIAGTFVGLFWGSQVIQWYSNFFQI
jgi:prepilin signal peptidase PulO-like enzyme (type II secretory pathway)